jgi:Fe-S-cluster containining protein
MIDAVNAVDIFDLCKNCRICCIGTEIRIYPEDIERWKKEDRLDILLSIDSLFGESRGLMKKDNNDECFFLSKEGKCNIQETKPTVCRKFPVSKKQAELFKCKLINALNLK